MSSITRALLRLSCVLLLPLLISACGDKPEPGIPGMKIGKPYQIYGKWYKPEFQPDYNEEGIASWYGPGFHGNFTASGEAFDQDAMTAAHTTLPMPSMVRVTNVSNGKSVIVRINDRGPFKSDRIIDLSKAAAKELDVIRTGTAKVRLQYLPQETEEYLVANNVKGREQIMRKGAEVARNLTQRSLADVQRRIDSGSNVLPAQAAPVQAIEQTDLHVIRPVYRVSNTYNEATVTSAPVPAPHAETKAVETGAANTQIPSGAIAGRPIVQDVQFVSGEAPMQPAMRPDQARYSRSASSSEAVAQAYVAAQPPRQREIIQVDMVESKLPEQVSGAPPPKRSLNDAFTQAEQQADVRPEKSRFSEQRVVPPPARSTGYDPPTQSVGTPPATGSAMPDSLKGKVYVHAGSFSVRENADKLRRQLASGGGNAMMTEINVNNRTWYRVRVGPLSSPQEGQPVLRQMQEMGLQDARIIQN